MSPVFEKEYSDSYDLLYREKDYDAECDLIEEIIRTHRSKPAHSILDLGCGTGNHALRLAQRGYSVTGVDRSEEMLEIARSKARDEGTSCEFIHSDLKEVSIGKKFDVVIMMFAVLGYQTENEDVIRALKTVRNHLKKGGLFICDVWYGPAVLHERPGEKIRVIQEGDIRIIRSSSGVLNSMNHTVTVTFHLWKIQGERFVSEVTEEHRMRFFFPQELDFLFRSQRLSINTITSFPDIQQEAGEHAWNICINATRL